MTTSSAKVILVPGAWMAGWIWEPTAQRLRERGMDAEAITLTGLDPDASDVDVAEIRLDDHVRQVTEHAARCRPCPVVLVSHSYSGLVTASAADRLGDQVIGLIHVGAFVAQDGRSLLDDWGDSEQERARERADIETGGNLWRAPTRELLEFETDLTPRDRDFLAARLTAHPGRTVLDRAHLATPAEDQPATYVALTAHGGFDDAWDDAPAIARRAGGWRRRHLVSGHWPMVSVLDDIVDLLDEEIRHHAAAQESGQGTT